MFITKWDIYKDTEMLVEHIDAVMEHCCNAVFVVNL